MCCSTTNIHNMSFLLTCRQLCTLHFSIMLISRPKPTVECTASVSFRSCKCSYAISMWNVCWCSFRLCFDTIYCNIKYLQPYIHLTRDYRSHTPISYISESTGCYDNATKAFNIILSTRISAVCREVICRT